MTSDLHNAGKSMLDRFADALARVIHDERPEALSRPVTVAELYQDIAPYRRMREMAGIEMHADYEHALLRFLAGEGGFAALDPETAADELGIEAESSDPDLSLYRKFAACDVRLNLPQPTGEAPVRRVVELPPVEPLSLRAPAPRPTRAEPDAGSPAPEQKPAAEPKGASRSEPLPPESTSSLAETLRALSIDVPPRPSAGRPAQRGTATHAAAPKAVAPRCGFCGQGLPADRNAHYCPHCGVDLTALQCGACGVEMEEGWRFCIACGAAAGS